MSRRTRGIALAGIVAAAAMILSGCTSTASDSKDVSYWGAFYAPTTEASFQKIFVDGFNASNDTQVSMQTKELSTLGQLTDTAVAAGQAPDVIYSDGPSSASDYARADRTKALDQYATQYGWKDKLLPWAYELSEVNGSLHSVPTSYGSMVLYYNKAVFAANGWTAPTNLAEFESIATQAAAKGITPLGGGNSGYQGASEWLLTAVLNAAVGPDKLYDVLSGKAKFTDPEFVAAIDLIKGWIDKGWLAGGAQSYFTTSDTDNITGLANGTTAMYMSGTWAFNSLSQTVKDSGDWDWAPLPSLSDSVQPGVFPLAIGSSLSVNAQSKNPDAAAAFINYLVGDTSRALSYTAETGENPPPVAITSDQLPSNIDSRAAKLYTAIPGTKNVGYATWTFLPPKTDGFLISEFDKVVTGDDTSQQFLDGLQKSFDSESAAGATLTPFAPEN